MSGGVTPSNGDSPYTAAFYGGPSGWGDGFNVVGPYIAGGWDGTVPQSHDGMKREDAEWLAGLLNKAFTAGRDRAQRQMRAALGIKR